MAIGLDLKEQLTFRITFARLYYGNGPFTSDIRSKSDQPDDESNERLLYLELKPNDHKLRRLLGKRPASARIYRHPTGAKLIPTGATIRGNLFIGDIDETDEGGTKYTYAEIAALLPTEVFDALAAALIAGGNDLLARARLQIGMKEPRDQIDFSKRDGPLESMTFLLEDLVITFDMGSKYEEFEELEEEVPPPAIEPSTEAIKLTRWGQLFRKEGRQ
jgi:hypothetical protein